MLQWWCQIQKQLSKLKQRHTYPWFRPQCNREVQRKELFFSVCKHTLDHFKLQIRRHFNSCTPLSRRVRLRRSLPLKDQRNTILVLSRSDSAEDTLHEGSHTCRPTGEAGGAGRSCLLPGKAAALPPRETPGQQRDRPGASCYLTWVVK